MLCSSMDSHRGTDLSLGDSVGLVYSRNHDVLSSSLLEDLVTKTKQLATRPENEQQDESVVLWLLVVVRCTLRYFERSVMACDSIVEQTELGKK